MMSSTATNARGCFEKERIGLRCKDSSRESKEELHTYVLYPVCRNYAIRAQMITRGVL
jgi:Zn finger protein HypA/HybF involved in hydrogenase expression